LSNHTKNQNWRHHDMLGISASNGTQSSTRHMHRKSIIIHRSLVLLDICITVGIDLWLVVGQKLCPSLECYTVFNQWRKDHSSNIYVIPKEQMYIKHSYVLTYTGYFTVSNIKLGLFYPVFHNLYSTLLQIATNSDTVQGGFA
jgi:hypothetical protein